MSREAALRVVVAERVDHLGVSLNSQYRGMQERLQREEAWSGVSISVRLKLLGLGRLGQLAQATVPVRCRRAGVVRRCLREVCYVPETRSLSQVFQRNDAAFEGAPRSQGASCHSARLSRMGRRGPQHGRSRQPRRKPPCGSGSGLSCQHEMAPAEERKVWLVVVRSGRCVLSCAAPSHPLLVRWGTHS